MFDALPDAAQGAVLGAAIAIFGVIINGILSSWNTGRQLAHDRQQKSVERSLQLRREIYLGVAQHLSQGHAVLGSFADTSVTISELRTEWRASSHFLSKLNLMAGPELTRAAHDAANGTALALLELQPLRDQLDGFKLLLKEIKARKESHVETLRRALEYVREQRLHGTGSVEQMKRVLQLSNEEKALSDVLNSQELGLLARINESELVLVRRIIDKQKELVPLLLPFYQFARSELGEIFDRSSFEAMLEEYGCGLNEVLRLIERISETRTVSAPRPVPVATEGSDRT